LAATSIRRASSTASLGRSSRRTLYSVSITSWQRRRS
jgi:hypothetical protein